MTECVACLGEGSFDFSEMDTVMARLARVVGRTYTPLGVVECEFCEGAGVVTEAQARDLEAWAVARTDQFLAAVDAGEIVL